MAVRRSHTLSERAPKNVARLVEQVAADHVRRAEVDQVPIVDLSKLRRYRSNSSFLRLSGVLLLALLVRC